MSVVIVKAVFTGLDQNGSGDLQELVCVKLWKGKVWSLGMDSQLKCWTKDLQKIAQHKLNKQYAITFNCDDDYLYLGTGHGQIIIFDENIQFIKSIQIGQDVISKIQITQKHIYVTSYDGSFVILDKHYLKLLKKIQLITQLHDICLYKQSIFVSGPTTYKINHDDYTYLEIMRADKFIIFKDELYGINHTNGLYSINDSFSTYSPSEVISTYNNYIISLFDQGVTIFDIDDKGCRWKSTFIQQFNSGYAHKDMISLGDNEFISCCQNGKLYKIKVICLTG